MKDLTVGKEGKLIFYFAVPLLLGNVFQTLNSIVDRIIVGKNLGTVAQAAIGEVFPVLFAMISLLMGISIGITVIISQYFGAKDMEKVKRSVNTAYIFVFISSLIISAAGFFLSRPIFELFDVPADVLPLAVSYTRIIMAGMILPAGLFCTLAILRGLGDSKTPLYFIILSSLLNIVIELIFIPVLHMGIEGAAYANVIAQTVTFFIATFMLNRRHEMVRISFSKWIFDKDIFKKSLKIGLPSGVQQFAVAIGQIFLMGLVNKFGTDTAAAFTIGGSIDALAMLPAMNFAMALMTFVGQNMGAGKPERVKKGLLSTQYMSGIFAVVITVLALLIPHSMVQGFNKDTNVIQIAVEYLFVVSPFYLLFSVMFINSGVFRGAGDTLIPMFITIISLWGVRIPLAYFLSKSIGEHGIWWSLPLAWATGVIFSILYYLSGRWKKRTIVKAKVTDE